MPLMSSRNLYRYITPKSGAFLHRILLKSVLGAPQSFFDETDSGVTLNRFSQDMTLIDGQLPQSASMVVTSMFSLSQFVLNILNVLRCVSLPGVNWFDCSGVHLHGYRLSLRTSSPLSSAEILLAHLTANAFSRLGIQESVIHSFR